MKIEHANYGHSSLATKLAYAKNLQVKYFTGENIPIYSNFPLTMEERTEAYPSGLEDELHKIIHMNQLNGILTTLIH